MKTATTLTVLSLFSSQVSLMPPTSREQLCMTEMHRRVQP